MARAQNGASAHRTHTHTHIYPSKSKYPTEILLFIYICIFCCCFCLIGTFNVLSRVIFLKSFLCHFGSSSLEHSDSERCECAQVHMHSIGRAKKSIVCYFADGSWMEIQEGGTHTISHAPQPSNREIDVFERRKKTPRTGWVYDHVIINMRVKKNINI